MINLLKRAYNYVKEAFTEDQKNEEDYTPDLEDEKVVKELKEEIEYLQAMQNAPEENSEELEEPDQKVRWHLKHEKYHLNRSMRRFLKAMGWDNIPPRSTTQNMWYFIRNLQRSPLKLHIKRKIFKNVLGK